MGELKDHGTPELVAHRLKLVKGGDANDSTNWLDILKARGVISQRQHQAGGMYAQLRFRLFGRGVVSVESQNGGVMSVEMEAKLRSQYEAATAALKCAGDRAYWNTCALVVDDRAPSWLKQPVKSDAGYISVQDGLDALVKHFRLR